MNWQEQQLAYIISIVILTELHEDELMSVNALLEIFLRKHDHIILLHELRKTQPWKGDEKQHHSHLHHCRRKMERTSRCTIIL